MRSAFLRSARAVIVAAYLVLTFPTFPIHGQAPARPVAFRTQTMGTWGTLTIMTPDSAAVADFAYEALSVFHRTDSLMSNWTDSSEIARINRQAALEKITIHPDVAAVLDVAQRVASQSDGAFDITIEPLTRLWGFLGGTPHVPSPDEIEQALQLVGHDKIRFDAGKRTIRFLRDGVRIDLGGIAKGFAVDEAAQVLRRDAVSDALVDLSGNMAALGNGRAGDGWIVGIRDPSGARDYIASFRLLSGEAVATSGDYEQFVDDAGHRYGHILDPRTGWSAHGLTSTTVVAASATLADAWATALFVLGPDHARRVATERDDIAAVLLEPQLDGKVIVWVEESLHGRFHIARDVTASHILRNF